MPPRKSLDIDPELAVLQAKADKIRTDHRLMLGDLVIETGVHKAFNADQLRAELVRLRDQVQGKRTTQQGGRTDAGSTFPAQPEANAKPNGHAEPEPARRHPSDLLEGTAPGRTGPRSATEEPEGD